jgi:hypothetical protein
MGVTGFMLRPLYTREESPSPSTILVDVRLRGPQNRSRCYGEEKNSSSARNQTLVAEPITSNYNERVIPGLVNWRITRIFSEFGLATCFHAGFLLSLFFRPWRLRRYVPPKRRWTLNGLHRVISQKVVLFITTAVRISNHTRLHTLPVTFFNECVRGSP